MRVPIEWLKDYVDTDKDAETLADLLTKTGSEAEGIEVLGNRVENLVVGLIERIEKHPNADRLVVCQVNVGSETVQIVTGAPNVEEGMLVPVVLPGAVLADGTKIKAAKLRGVESFGMLCSKEELGLEEKSEGILVLPQDEGIQPGQDVNELLKLGSPIVSFGITPNRPDCLSMVGMAREVGIIEGKPLRLPRPEVSEVPSKAADVVKVTVKARDLCPRYACRVIEDVKLGPSPLWMQQRLIAAGMRPINNIVDITNYVMLELGQPLHAFDADKIAEGEIIVREAEENEVLKTLDGVERKLEKGMLLIADPTQPLALAGIMGGESSEITESTKRVLLESANFNRGSIRRTSRKLGLRSEASSRFEKGLDPELVFLAADRAAELLEKYAGGKVYSGTVVDGDYEAKETVVETTASFINRLLGLELEKSQIVEILTKVGLEVASNGDALTVKVPSFRQDIEQEVDLAEEVARIYGLDNIPDSIPKGEIASSGLTQLQKVERILARELASIGYSELITYSFLSEKRLEGLPGEPVRIANPLSEEQAVLRTSLLPSLLKAVETNYNRLQKDVAFFEIAKIYLKSEGQALPEEKLMLGAALAGKKQGYFDAAPGDVDFYDLKGALDYLGSRLRLTFDYAPSRRPRMHPGRCADVSLDGRVIGYIGQIHPDETEEPVYFLEIEVEPLTKGLSEVVVYKGLTRFPAVFRDIALVGPMAVPAKELTEAIINAGGRHLVSVELFDLYTGPQVGEGKKSLAYALMFQSEERTLTDSEIDEALKNIQAKVAEKDFIFRA